MITLDYNSSMYVFFLLSMHRFICSTIQSAEQELFPLVAAIGVGFLYQIPIVALQAAMPTKDMATATSGFMFLR